MKTKTLKLEGSEKIKFRIEIEYNEVTVTLTQGGNPTKFSEKIICSICLRTFIIKAINETIINRLHLRK